MSSSAPKPWVRQELDTMSLRAILILQQNREQSVELGRTRLRGYIPWRPVRHDLYRHHEPDPGNAGGGSCAQVVNEPPALAGRMARFAIRAWGAFLPLPRRGRG